MRIEVLPHQIMKPQRVTPTVFAHSRRDTIAGAVADRQSRPPLPHLAFSPLSLIDPRLFADGPRQPDTGKANRLRDSPLQRTCSPARQTRISQRRFESLQFLFVNHVEAFQLFGRVDMGADYRFR